jgi:hypothetical protein
MLLAAQLKLRLLVNVWYDDLPQKAFLKTQGLGPRAGRQQAERFGEWVHWFSSLNRLGFRAMLRRDSQFGPRAAREPQRR